MKVIILNDHKQPESPELEMTDEHLAEFDACLPTGWFVKITEK